MLGRVLSAVIARIGIGGMADLGGKINMLRS